MIPEAEPPPPVEPHLECVTCHGINTTPGLCCHECWRLVPLEMKEAIKATTKGTPERRQAFRAALDFIRKAIRNPAGMTNP
jgi:hypothetical protein